jgi:hypothetical protein
MGPIEILFYTIVVIFAVIGLVRGAHRELGNSIIFMYMVALFGLASQQGWFRRAVEVASIFGSNPAQLDEATFILIVTIFTTVVVVTYQGVTFDFSAKRITGFFGVLAGLAVGALNGYLIAGTFWHYANVFGYPFNLLTGPLTATGQALLPFLPPAIFPNPVYWAVPATLLMILRIWR